MCLRGTQIWPNTWITLIQTNGTARNQATVLVPRYFNRQYIQKGQILTERLA